MHCFRPLPTLGLVALVVATFATPADAVRSPVVPPLRASAPEPTNARQGSADFNGDGYADLAIGVPEEDLGDIINAGAVNVLYGSPTAPNILSSADDQKWTQDSEGIRDSAESGDNFGFALAWGDFDDDGYDDLAIGIKGEDVGTDSGAGAVSVLYGSASGLTAEGDDYFTQNSSDIADTAEQGDNFGYSLAAANFGDPCGPVDYHYDLAIGVRNEDLGPEKENAGAINVIYGTKDGLDACGDQFWTQDSSEGGYKIDGVAEADDRFGSSLEAGSFGGYSWALAIGVPEEDLGTAIDAGAVNELRSFCCGLVAQGNKFWSQNKDSVSDVAETDDQFGYALAAENFGPHDDLDFQHDLAIGVPGEDGDEGAVHVLWGSWDCCLVEEGYFLTQMGTEEAGAQFGLALAAGHHSGSGDLVVLAIGTPGDDVDEMVDAGSVTLQSWTGGAPGSSIVITQNSPEIEDTAEVGDMFGSSLAFAPTSGTYWAMLAVGVPEEEVGAIVDSGAVNVLYVDSVDFYGPDDQFWTQDSEGVNDSAEANDSFGDALG